MINVCFFHRKPTGRFFSIERFFQVIRDYLPVDLNPVIAVCPFESHGVLPRLINMISSFFMQSDINHITGDVQYLAIFMKKRKTVLSIMDCAGLETLKGIKKWLLFFFWYWLPVKRSARIVVISNSTKHELLRYVKCDPDKIQVIHCPLPDRFKPISHVFNEQYPCVLQIGTKENKNIDRVIEALAEIPCNLRVIGPLSAQQKTRLTDLCIEYSTVDEVTDDDIIQEYVRCDLVCFASTYEGFGLPIIEANAIGRPVITSNILSMPEVAGDAACIVNPFDVSSIREGIFKVIHNRAYRDELIRNGYENIERFRPEKISQKYASLYRILHSHQINE